MKKFALTVWYVLRLRCEEADRVRSKGADATVAERTGERLHAALCGSCRAVRRQLKLVDEGLDSIASGGEEHAEATASLDTEARDRIAQRLRDASK